MDFSLNDHQWAAWTKRSPPVLREALREIGDLFSAAVLRTIVAQLRLARDYSVDAGDSAEIFVDGAKVMIRHVFIDGPWHYLETSPVERSRNAARVKDSWWARRMEVIHVYAGPHDLNKLCKRVAPFGQPGSIGCQVAGEDVRGKLESVKGAEIPAATQVRRRVDLLGLLVKKVGVSTRDKFSLRAGAVAA